MLEDFECSLGFSFFIESHATVLSRFRSSTVTLALFSVLPAVLCVVYYYRSVNVLFKRKKKLGRNLNLIICFSTICIIWWFTFLVRYAFFVYSLVVSLTAPLRKVYQYPVIRNLYLDFILNNFSSFSSIINPIMFLLAQTDYREPFLKGLEKFRRRPGSPA